MKAFTVIWRQTFETRLQHSFKAHSIQGAINKARKLSKEIKSPKEVEHCLESSGANDFGGDDFLVRMGDE